MNNYIFYDDSLITVNFSIFIFDLNFVFMQNEDFPEEKIRFGMESIYIDSWMRRRIYDTFKEIMESGVRHHLQVKRVY